MTILSFKEVHIGQILLEIFSNMYTVFSRIICSNPQALVCIRIFIINALIETGACVLISRSKYDKEKVQTVKRKKSQIIEQTVEKKKQACFIFDTYFGEKTSKEGIAITGPEIIWLTGIHPDEVGKRERNSE